MDCGSKQLVYLYFILLTFELCKPCEVNSNCTSCNNRNCDNNVCVEGCVDGCWGADCSRSCPAECRKCDATGRCLTCVDGLFGNNCNLACPMNCNICDRSMGNCLNCKNGTYLYNNQCMQCPTKCKTCTSSLWCIECVSGYWGSNCGKSCLNCKSGTTCRKDNGVCTDSCIDGKTGLGCNKHCNPLCKSCERNSAFRCTACAVSKYGLDDLISACTYDCPKNCQLNTCDDKTGACTFGCKHGYWGLKCNSSCHVDCTTQQCHRNTGICYYSKENDSNISYSCPAKCDCDNHGQCISCKKGYSNVINKCENTTVKCRDKFQSTCSSNEFYEQDDTCCPCHMKYELCDECTNNMNDGHGECTKCQVGSYASRGTCIKCPAGCKNNTCDPISGACTIGCIELHWGAQCDRLCDLACLECDRYNGTCYKCLQGKYSSDCSKSCESCKTVVSNVSSCDILKGTCLNGCQSLTDYGSLCDRPCSSNCVEQHCDWLTGHCLNGCVHNRYGNTCDHGCSSTCFPPTSGRSCYEANGTCIHGCVNGYYGDKCDTVCSVPCENMTCDRSTGYCQPVCKGGHIGKDCATNISDNDMIDNSVSTVRATIIWTSSLIIVVLIVIFIWKWRIHKNHTIERRAALAVQDNGNTDIGEVIYEQIDEVDEINVHQSTDINSVIVPMSEDVGQTSTYEQLNHFNDADRTSYSLLDVDTTETRITYENLRII